MARLNSTLDDIAHVAGYTAARRIAAWWPSRNLYIPSQAKPDHPLALVVGMPAFRALVEAFPVQFLTIPSTLEDQRDLREREIAAAVVAGETDAALAARFSVTVRRIGQIRLALTDSGLLDYVRLEE